MVNDILVLSERAVWQVLQDVKDPEIPVLSVVDMNIVTKVVVNGESVQVEITPTFSGCPAMDMIQTEIADRLRLLGFSDVVVTKNLTKSWSTDLLSDGAREKLRSFGIAPPSKGVQVTLNVACPRCASTDTRLDSPFGSALCRQIFFCNNCKESFERFKHL